MRRMRGPASPAPSALRPRSPSRRCAERSAVVDSGNTVRARLLTRAHTTYVAPEPTSTHAHSLTRRSLSSRHSVTQRGHAWMDAHAPHRHAAGWRQVSRRTLQSNPFLLPFFSNFQVSSKSCVTAHPLLSATPCVRHLDTTNLPQPRAPSRR